MRRAHGWSSHAPHELQVFRFHFPMSAPRPIPMAGVATGLLALAWVLAAAAWGIPARTRAVHPLAMEAAGRNTPSTVAAAESMVSAGKPGPAAWLAAAAAEAGLAGTNTLSARVAAGMAIPGARAWGGPAPQGAPTFAPAGTNGAGANPAADLFMTAEARRAWRQRVEASRSPGARAIWEARAFAPRRFVAVDRPGGQPLEGTLLLMATLQEHDGFSDGLGAAMQSLVAKARPGQPAEVMEQVCLDLLVLSRRMDWTSMVELLRTMPDPVALREWTATVQQDPAALPILTAASVLSGRPEAMTGRLRERGSKGRGELLAALRGGQGSARWLAGTRLPVIDGAWGWPWLAPWTSMERMLAGWLRLGLLVLSAAMAGAGAAVAMDNSTEGRRARARRAVALTAVAATLLMLPAEPWGGTRQAARLQLGLATTTGTTGAKVNGKTVQGRALRMETSTLGTIAIFGALQAAVYVLCRRKIAEILAMDEPAAVRLRLMENEENLFDAGLYLGIAGTASALVLQVLQLVEANLLAAYSSNLMGLVTVALVKIVHVRQARRGLIIEARTPATA